MKIKVLHVIHSLSGGGAETQSQLLACGLENSLVESYFFCLNSDNHRLKSEKNIFCYTRKSKYDFRFYVKMAEAIEEVKPNIIHVWLPAAVSIPAMFLAKYKNIPVIFSYRNRMFFHRFISIPEFLVALFCAKKIVSNNAIEQSNLLFRWLYKKKNGVTIYNAVETDGVNHKVASVRKANYNFLYVGRLTKQKNVAFMLYALSKLSVEYRWTIDIFGVGELENELRKLAIDLGISQYVVFKGYASDIKSKMLEYDLLVFPSLYEGMPNVLVEALALGLPVFASDIFASRDVVGESASVFWFQPNDISTLVTGLKQYMDDPDSVKERVLSGFKLSKRFSVSSMSQQYKKLYELLL